jgi:hypothetical protein
MAVQPLVMEVPAAEIDAGVHNPRAIKAPHNPPLDGSDSLGDVVDMPSDVGSVLRSLIAKAKEASVPVPAYGKCSQLLPKVRCCARAATAPSSHRTH